jgi:4-amino-4-deoxy-L-arabinose transferase-like glycosyltransferase
VPIWLYLLAAVLLLVDIGGHPPYAYNWENYTAWGMFRYWDDLAGRGDLFRMSDGLMTDSGEGPLMVIPIWLGWSLFGVGIEGLRIPVVVIGALAAPLTWLVGRRTVGPWAAGIGAVLLALSPVFLLYGRTATLVGISLVPALATVYALLRVLRPERERFGVWIGWLAALQVLLVADAYAYAVIRFLWLIALILLAGELALRRGVRLRFAVAFAVTAVVLPLALLALGARDGFSAGPGQIDETLRRYYNGRGEQIVALNDDPDGYRYFLEDAGEVDVAVESTEDLAWRLIGQNAKDYLDLHLDRDTLPAITDYWNPQGRLLPQVQVPFFLLGLVVLVALAWRPAVGVEARAMLALYFGLGIPLFLTSRVHIGRLIFTVPLLCLVVGLGVVALVRAGRIGAGVLGGRAEGEPGRIVGLASPAVVLAVILIGLTASRTWADYTISPRPEPQRGWALAMEEHLDEVRAAGGAVLVMPSGLGAEIEGVDAAGMRLIAGDSYRFVNLRVPAPDGGAEGDDPPLYFGNVLGLLAESPERVPNRCAAVYFVRPDAQEEFGRVTDNGRPAGCAEPVRVVVLG